MLKRSWEPDPDVDVADEMEEEAQESEDQSSDSDSSQASEYSEISLALLEQYQQSVVKIFITEFIPDHQFPWRGSRPRVSHGTGSVIKVIGDKVHILTCAHVARFGSKISVRACNDIIDYPAKVIVSEADCDLALVEVESKEFLKNLQVVQFGELQVLASEVLAMGFPVTGEEITTTTGIVTSNEFDDYTEGDAFNLVSNTDTAINPGNSGGPVFDKQGNQVGVVFQAYTPDWAEKAGQFTPVTVIQQFLTSAYQAIGTGNYPKGIPALPMETRRMLNPAIRKAYHMTDSHSGVCITAIDTLAIGKLGGLQVDDVILSIDEHPIQNDGTINIFPEISERLDYRYLITRKQIGDTINMKILREGVEFNLTVPLSYRANELKLVGRKDYAASSSFCIINGLCFQPGSYTLLEDEKITQLGQIYDMEQGHIMTVPQRAPHQQLVILNCIFNCEKTNGYENSFLCSVVESVNGKMINNMAELIHAMKTHTGPQYCVRLKNHDDIIVTKMSPAEENELFKSYGILKSHSDDYAPLINSIQLHQSQSSSSSTPLQLSQDKSMEIVNNSVAQNMVIKEKYNA